MICKLKICESEVVWPYEYKSTIIYESQCNVLFVAFLTNRHRNHGLAKQAGSKQCTGLCKGRVGDVFSAIHAKFYSDFLISPKIVTFVFMTTH